MFFKAAILKNTNKVIIQYLKIPEKLFKGQILIKIIYSSICHTQLMEIKGKRGKDNYLPHCLGHEGVGIVKKTYRGCKNFKNGDYVCLSWIKSKNYKARGVIYKNDKGEKINAGPVHTLNTYGVIDESRIYKLKNRKDIKKKVLLGCALPTTFNIFLENKDIANKSSICIIGAGGLGISFLILAQKLGYNNISVVDKNKRKIDLLKKFRDIKTYTNINEISNLKFDFVIECTGNIKILENIHFITKKFGGRVIVVGNYPNGSKLSLNPWNIINGINYKGVWNSEINFSKKFNKLEKIFNDLKNLETLSNKVYNLKDINKAINDFKNGKIIRPIIKM